MLISKRNTQYFFILILSIIFFLCVFTAFAYPDRSSDIGAHIRKLESIAAGEATTGYPVMYYSTEIIHKAFDLPLNISFGIFLGLCSVLTMFILYWLFKTNAQCSPIVAFLGALCVSVILHVYFPGGILKLYYGQGGGNVWHNPSTTAMKPFAVVSFISFAMLLDKLVKKKGKSNDFCILNDEQFTENALYAIFVIATILSLLAKPSFVFGFIIAGVIMMLIRIRYFDKKFFFIMLFTSILLGGIMLWQFSEIFKESGMHGGGLVFSPARAIYYIGKSTKSIPLSILSHLLYPIAMLGLFYKDIKPTKNNIYLLSWVFYFVSMAIYFSITEASLPQHLNMGWTRSIAIFMLQIATTLEFLKSIKKRETLRQTPERRKYDICLGIVLVCLILQVIPGLQWLYSFI